MILFIKVIIHVAIEDDPPSVKLRTKKREYEARKAQESETQQESEEQRFEFRERYVTAPHEYEHHVDLVAPNEAFK